MTVREATAGPESGQSACIRIRLPDLFQRDVQAMRDNFMQGGQSPLPDFGAGHKNADRIILVFLQLHLGFQQLRFPCSGEPAAMEEQRAADSLQPFPLTRKSLALFVVSGSFFDGLCDFSEFDFILQRPSG